MKKEAAAARWRDGSGRSHPLHATPNRVDETDDCNLTFAPPDKCFDPRNSKMHFCFHAFCCYLMNLADQPPADHRESVFYSPFLRSCSTTHFRIFSNSSPSKNSGWPAGNTDPELIRTFEKRLLIRSYCCASMSGKSDKSLVPKCEYASRSQGAMQLELIRAFLTTLRSNRTRYVFWHCDGVHVVASEKSCARIMLSCRGDHPIRCPPFIFQFSAGHCRDVTTFQLHVLCANVALSD